MSTFLRELESTVNRFSKENDSDTPDFILALFLNRCILAFEEATRAREKWYDQRLFVGMKKVEENRVSPAQERGE